MSRSISCAFLLIASTVWFAGCARAPQQASTQPVAERQLQTPTAAAFAPATPAAATTAEPSIPEPATGTPSNPPNRPSAMSPPPQMSRAAEPSFAAFPAGTLIRIRTSNTLSTKTARPGETFTATLIEPFKGATAIGRIVDSNPGGRIKGVAHLSVRMTQIRFADGRTIDLQTNSYTKKARTTRKRDALKIGIGSGVGASIGAVAAGGVGAAVGAAAGGAAGTGYVLTTRGVPAVIPSESILTFRLQNSIRR